MFFAIEQFFQHHQAWLWFVTVMLDLGFAVLMFRLFGRYGLYGVIVFSLLLANIQGPKLTMILGLQTSMGVILYSSIFFATDLLSEKYGRREAQRAVLLGFAVSVMLVVLTQVGLLYQPTQEPETAAYALGIHEAMAALFDYTPRFVFGSLLAYLLSQSFDVWVFHRIRKATGAKHLWLRNTGSTLLSQVVDTLIYGLVVWWGIVDFVTALQLAAAKYVFKFGIAVIDTPFIYWAKSWRGQGQFAPATQRSTDQHPAR
ncbi:queuosine precursor transporter [Candidatus Foliamicus sp.]